MIRSILVLFTFCILIAASFSAYGERHFSIKKSDRDAAHKATTNELLKSYLELTAFRHKVLSENLANANTPGYKAQDVANPKEYSDLSGKGRAIKTIGLIKTADNHIDGKQKSGGKFIAQKLQDPYEIKPNGNNVSLAQQMTKISQNQQDYNSAVKGYAVMNNLISAALGK